MSRARDRLKRRRRGEWFEQVRQVEVYRREVAAKLRSVVRSISPDLKITPENRAAVELELTAELFVWMPRRRFVVSGRIVDPMQKPIVLDLKYGDGC